MGAAKRQLIVYSLSLTTNVAPALARSNAYGADAEPLVCRVGKERSRSGGWKYVQDQDQTARPFWTGEDVHVRDVYDGIRDGTGTGSMVRHL
jgi:hypothetical protein